MAHLVQRDGLVIRVDVHGLGERVVVIAAEDPGVANWLDPAGHSSGVLQYRFAFTKTEPEPELRSVPLASLEDELPLNTPRVGPEERRAAIYRRRQHVLRRYHLY